MLYQVALLAISLVISGLCQADFVEVRVEDWLQDSDGALSINAEEKSAIDRSSGIATKSRVVLWGAAHNPEVGGTHYQLGTGRIDVTTNLMLGVLQHYYRPGVRLAAPQGHSSCYPVYDNNPFMSYGAKIEQLYPHPFPPQAVGNFTDALEEVLIEAEQNNDSILFYSSGQWIELTNALNAIPNGWQRAIDLDSIAVGAVDVPGVNNCFGGASAFVQEWRSRGGTQAGGLITPSMSGAIPFGAENLVPGSTEEKFRRLNFHGNGSNSSSAFLIDYHWGAVRDEVYEILDHGIPNGPHPFQIDENPELTVAFLHGDFDNGPIDVNRDPFDPSNVRQQDFIIVPVQPFNEALWRETIIARFHRKTLHEQYGMRTNTGFADFDRLSLGTDELTTPYAAVFEGASHAIVQHPHSINPYAPYDQVLAVNETKAFFQAHPLENSIGGIAQMGVSKRNCGHGGEEFIIAPTEQLHGSPLTTRVRLRNHPTAPAAMQAIVLDGLNPHPRLQSSPIPVHLENATGRYEYQSTLTFKNNQVQLYLDGQVVHFDNQGILTDSFEIAQQQDPGDTVYINFGTAPNAACTLNDHAFMFRYLNIQPYDLEVSIQAIRHDETCITWIDETDVLGKLQSSQDSIELNNQVVERNDFLTLLLSNSPWRAHVNLPHMINICFAHTGLNNSEMIPPGSVLLVRRDQQVQDFQYYPNELM